MSEHLGSVQALPVPYIRSWPCTATVEQVRENIRSAVVRDLPGIKEYEPHGCALSIIGGGPSLADTWDKITPGSYIAAANKAHDYLIERGVTPHFCGLLDPEPGVADLITPHEDVTYLLASMCHPAVFDKLAGHKVKIWHAGQGEHVRFDDLVPEGTVLHAGGTTISLRLVEIGHWMGFRRFHLHGMDSSFRNGCHAYPCEDYEGDPRLEIQGYETVMTMLMQVSDVARRLPVWQDMGIEEMTVHGDGLFQHLWRQQYGDVWRP